MDYLINELLPIKHLENHFHTNTDSYLLMSFAKILHKSRVMDLGCNNGALMLMASIFHPKSIEGIDIVKDSVDIANENFALNGVEAIAYHRDIVGYRSKGKYDVILCNPPYYEMIDKNDVFTNARHQHHLRIDDVMDTIHHLLENKGRAYVIYPTNQLATLIDSASNHYLRVSRLRLFQPNYQKRSNVVMVELMLGVNSDIKIEPVMTYDDLMAWKKVMNRDIIKAKLGKEIL